jgi:hypothetical protein
VCPLAGVHTSHEKCLRWSVGVCPDTKEQHSFLESMRDMHMGMCTAVDSLCKEVGSEPPSRNGLDKGKAHPGIENSSLSKHDVTEGFMTLA